MKNKKILVIGGTGILGTYIVTTLLDHGFTNVEVFSRSGYRDDLPYSSNSRVHFVKGDIREIYPLEDCISNADYVIHGAAMVSYDPRKFDEMHAINVEGTANVVNMCLESNVEKLVYISSIAAIGKDDRTDIVDESGTWVNDENNSYYGITKYLAEQNVWRAYYEGLPSVIINPSVILSDGDWNQSSGLIFGRVYDGLRYHPKGGTGFVDVRDVSDMVVTLLQSEIEGNRYIASQGNYYYKDVFIKMSKYMNKPFNATEAKDWILEILWRIEKLRTRFTKGSPLITRQTVRSMSKMTHYDNTKSKTIDGFSYRDMDESLAFFSTRYVAYREKLIDKI